MKKLQYPKEYKLVCLRECPIPAEQQECNQPDKVYNYFTQHMIQHRSFQPDVENFMVIMVNTRRKIIGHVYISTGTLDTILVHPREVFKASIVMNASALVIVHNHPSGDPTPSEADIKVTRDLIRAGQILKIDVLDHVIVGVPNPSAGYTSLRELGYFYS